jgi:uncharacterized RDD family membrane protein YckC
MVGGHSMEAASSCWHCGARIRPGFTSCRACGSSIRRSAREARQDDSIATSVVDYQLASLIARFFALLIDGIITGVLTGLALIPLLASKEDEFAAVSGDPQASAEWMVEQLSRLQFLALGVMACYYLLFLCTWGRTIGCLLTGIKVIDESGGRLSPVAVLMRVLVANLSIAVYTFGYFLDYTPALVASNFIGFFALFGYAMAMWDSRKQTLHDRAAGSIVVSASRY